MLLSKLHDWQNGMIKNFDLQSLHSIYNNPDTTKFYIFHQGQMLHQTTFRDFQHIYMYIKKGVTDQVPTNTLLPFKQVSQQQYSIIYCYYIFFISIIYKPTQHAKGYHCDWPTASPYKVTCWRHCTQVHFVTVQTMWTQLYWYYACLPHSLNLLSASMNADKVANQKYPSLYYHFTAAKLQLQNPTTRNMTVIINIKQAINQRTDNLLPYWFKSLDKGQCDT